MATGAVLILVAENAGRRSFPALDPGPLQVGLARFGGQRSHRFLDPRRELARTLFGLKRHRLADTDPHRSRERELLASRHDLVRAADVHRDDWRAGLAGEVPDPRLELLDPAVGRPAALG